MTVLLVHNRYRQPGGEDVAFEREFRLLSAAGESIETWCTSNDELDESSPLKLAMQTFWNREAADQLRGRVQACRPRVVHFHNTFPRLSWSVLHAARAEGAAVVQTLHNYRLLCPAATFFREGRICEDCLGKPLAWPAIRHACYRGSRGASLVTAGMIAGLRVSGFLATLPDAYVVLSDFAKRKFVEGGLPADRLHVMSNYLETIPNAGRHDQDYMFFAGRLTPEKGLLTLLAAWRQLGEQAALRIAGDGPLLARIRSEAPAGVEVLGPIGRDAVAEMMRGAAAVLLPSEWYEGHPMSLIEAMASAAPVIASRIGGIPEWVDDGRTGLLFSPGNAADLHEKICWTLDHPIEARAMGQAARENCLSGMSGSSAHRRLQEIFSRAMEVAAERRT